MRIKLLTLFVSLGIFLCLSGCYITKNPFADITKLGTVIEPDCPVTLQSEIGPVTIEYVAPTKRRLIWNGESREFNLQKSSQHMGVLAETEFKQGSIKNIYGINYSERTLTFRSEAELNKYIQTYDIFRHQVDDQMIVRCQVGDRQSFFSKNGKILYISVYKYQIADEKDTVPPPWGYYYPVESNNK